MDSISEERLNLVYPELARRIRQLATMLDAEGITIRVTQGLRSYPDQLALWQKGRDANGNVIDEAAVVTHARPEHSWHTFGCAVDVAPFGANGDPDWNLSHPSWNRIVEIGESLGLYSGSHFEVIKNGEVHPEPDFPHLQLTGRFPSSPDSYAIYLFKEGGAAAVWKEVDGALGVTS